MSRRQEIKLKDDEAASFMAEQRVVVCATNGPRGWPHLMPLWFVLREPAPGDSGPQVWAWTYAASQKARNLERDARATLQLETGDTYDQLRGVMLETEVVLHHDLETVTGVGMDLFTRYAAAPGQPPLGPDALPVEVRAMVQAQAPKRVGLQFVERRRASWDHRKLGGTY